MPVLGIESSTRTASIALVHTGELVAEDLFCGRMSLAEELAPRIRDLLEHEKLALTDLSGVAVSIGPGSFTGLRIGVATAKALAHATRLPLLGIPTAEGVAAAAAWAGAPEVHVVLSAWRDRSWVVSLAAAPGDEPRSLDEPKLVDESELLEVVRRRAAAIAVAGTLSESLRQAIRECLGDQAILPPPALSLPRASMVAAVAETRFARGERADLHALRPLYYRPSQAELSKGVDLGL